MYLVYNNGKTFLEFAGWEKEHVFPEGLIIHIPFLHVGKDRYDGIKRIAPLQNPALQYWYTSQYKKKCPAILRGTFQKSVSLFTKEHPKIYAYSTYLHLLQLI
jgi:hypothetical protein